MVCRRGDYDILKLFMDYGCNVQICDDFGRTPLHDACWTAKPNFEIVDLILSHDRRLMNIVDCRGSGPLSYVNKDYWVEWMHYLDSVKDKFWRWRDVKEEGEEVPPELVGKSPDSVPLVISSLCQKAVVDDIALVAMGKIEPETLSMNAGGRTSMNRISSRPSIVGQMIDTL